ncbi:MAG: hypothetical protein M3157_06490 [Actinomycetota bacterium]|nr:hypothetical protein [Actinomycetota bacterium]
MEYRVNHAKEAKTRVAEESRVRPWPVTALGMILLSQAALFSAVGAARLGAPGLGWLEPLADQLDPLAGAGLVLLAPAALVAAIGFFRLWSVSWTIGVGIQGLSLLVAITLYLYSNVNLAYVYGGMAYHILTVLYLNSRGVRDAFRVRGHNGL